MTETPPAKPSRSFRGFNLIPLIVVAIVAGIFAYQQDLVPELRVKQNSYPDETLPRWQVTIFESPITGAEYEIYVQPPHGYYESDKTYPVFYALNGRWAISFHRRLVLPLMREGKIPEAIFVGIDQEPIASTPFSPTPANVNPRARDYTFVKESNVPYETGGAPEFLEFVRNNIVPYVDGTFRTDPEDRGLAGHSLAGLFVLYAALSDPELFQRFVALSPQLYRGDFAILDLEEKLAGRRDDLPISLYLSIGETEAPEFLRGWEAMTDALLTRDYPGFRFKHEMHAESGGDSAVIAAMHSGFAFVYDSAF